VFIERHKAGSPTDAKVYWIHLTPREIALKFELETGFKVSNGFVKGLLKTLGFKYRKLSKTLATGDYARRDEQFKIIFQLVALVSLKTPILSIDCKKKERLGNLYRDGKMYCTAPIEVFDHDYGHLSKGIVIPHGIYDLQRNEGYVSIGSSHETAEFTKDNLLWWWDNFGIHYYPDTSVILILCDAGGSNSYRHFVFKKQMQILAATIGKDIIVCHYPPYVSKWNPIEHRLFCHIHTAMKGVVFSDYNIVKELIAKTTTVNNLKVFVRLNLKDYPTGGKVDKLDIDFSKIHFNHIIPELSYRFAA
jgi:Rhodopirellula transposase DDE domain